MNNLVVRLFIAAVVMVLLWFAVNPAQALPAFPGAEGGGATSLGGRGGEVIEVTTLNDSGAGSLRACMAASGKRTCVFRVGGTIDLKSSLGTGNPFLTIAGHTAPGGGILLKGNTMAQTMMFLSASDIVMRYIRIRKGHNPACIDECGANVVISKSRVILDHISSSWNQDEGLAGQTPTGLSLDGVTFQYSLVAEPLAVHPTAWLFASGTSAASALTTNVDLHHNLTASSNHRNPLLRLKSARVVNNLWYNLRALGSRASGGSSIDYVGNKYKAGPSKPIPTFSEIGHLLELKGFSAPGTPSIYLSGNVGWHQTNPAADQWLMAATISGGENGGDSGPIVSSWRRSTALAATTHPITVEAVGNIEGSILPTVGASRRLDCEGKWVINRDAVDARLLKEYTENTGIKILIASETEVGGYPIIDGGTPCADTDHDGMPDQYEVIKGFNSAVKDNNGDADADGYTNLEEYLTGETGAALPPSGQKFQTNDRVYVSSTEINVRAAAGGTLSGTQSQNAQGTVIGGPTVTAANSVVWYQINYDSGTDGWSGQDNLELVVDAAVKPSVSVTAPAANATVAGSSVSVTASASDNVGVSGVQFKLDGANLLAEDTVAPYSITWDSTTAVNGPHILTAVARDAVGNTTTSVGIAVTANNVPTNGFTIGQTTALGTNDTVGGNIVFAQAYTLSQRAQIISMTIYVNSSAGNLRMGIYDDDGASGAPSTLLGETAGGAPPGAGWYTQNIVTPVTLAPGTYYLALATNGSAVVKGQSTGGTNKQDNFTYGPLTNPYVVDNTGTWQWSYYATFLPAPDTTVPTTAITAPSAGDVSGAAVSVTASASDNVAVAGVSFHAVLPGGSPDASNIIGVEDTTSSYGVTWDTTTRVNGPYNVISVARDAAGNKGTSAAVAVTVANTLATPSGLAVVRTAP